MAFWKNEQLHLILASYHVSRALARPIVILAMILAGALINTNPKEDKPTPREQTEEATSGILGSTSPRQHIEYFEQFSEVIEQDPTIAEAYVGRGNLYLRWGDRMPGLMKGEKEAFGVTDISQLRSLAMADYQKALFLFQEQGDRKMQKLLQEAISCIPTGEDCQIYLFN